MSNEFQIIQARRESGPVTISIAGMSGSGKTYSALLLARGLVGPKGKIVVIDTEGNRSLIYADDSDIGGFLQMNMRPPFSSDRMGGAITAAVSAGADCIILDSASHEHDGEGGLLDYAYAEEQRMGKKGFSNWIRPKQAHKKYVQAILGAPAHVIITLRQHAVTVVDAKKQGGRVGDKVVSTICDSQLIFEMTLAVILDAQYQPTYTKCPKPLQGAIRQGEPLTLEHGRLLAGEAARGAPAAPEPHIIHYPGGRTVRADSLEAYKQALLKSAENAGDKLEEFIALNLPLITGRIAVIDPEISSLIIEELAKQGTA